MKGFVHIYARDHINTDEIIPARYLNVSDEKELALHAMEDIDPEFVAKVKPGDLVIAGEDFGCGSSREHAVWALRGAGVAAVIAPSFARIFFRNAINNGFPAIECREAQTILKNGEQAEVDVERGVIRNVANGRTCAFTPLSDFARNLLAAGGLLPYVLKKGQN